MPNTLPPTLKKGGAGVIVGIFYVLIVSLAVILLAAVQFRAAGGSTFDTWRINYDSAQALISRYEAKLHGKDSAEKDGAESAKKKDDCSLSDNSCPLYGKRSRNRDSQSYTDQCLKFFDESTGELKRLVNPETVSAYKIARSAGKLYNDESVESEVSCLLRGFYFLQYDRDYFKSADDQLQKEIAEIEEKLKSLRTQYSDLVKDHQDFVAFKEMEKDRRLKIFLEMPYDLLVLLLVVLMGALGGIVRILRDYGDVKRHSPSPRDYFFLPLIGAVVAVGGYVLAKTGLLLLSSTRGETSLSPFMIGLVGIVSGLLAREVIDSLAGTGRKLFAAPRGRRRARRPR